MSCNTDGINSSKKNAANPVTVKIKSSLPANAPNTNGGMHAAILSYPKDVVVSMLVSKQNSGNLCTGRIS
jgi:hypothetical protein